MFCYSYVTREEFLKSDSDIWWRLSCIEKKFGFADEIYLFKSYTFHNDHYIVFFCFVFVLFCFLFCFVLFCFWGPLGTKGEKKQKFYHYQSGIVVVYITYIKCSQQALLNLIHIWNYLFLQINLSLTILFHKKLKGALDKFNIIPQVFPKKVGIFIPLEVLAWVMTACRVLCSRLTYFWRYMNISSIFYFSKSTSINTQYSSLWDTLKMMLFTKYLIKWKRFGRISWNFRY